MRRAPRTSGLTDGLNPICCCGGHGILENTDPIAEDQVAGDEDAFAFVPFGQEGEKHLHFIAALLDVADVVEDHCVIDVEGRQLAFEAKVSLGGQQPLDERKGNPVTDRNDPAFSRSIR